MRFHLDEHVSRAIAIGLRRRGIDVTTTHETAMAGAEDAAHLAFALAERRVVVTHDADFLRLSAEGVPHFGIAYCDQQKHSIGDLVRLLLMLDELYSEDELQGDVEYL